MKSWVILFVAIVAEVIATSALKASNGFSKLLPSLIVVAGYAIAFYGLSLTLKTIPVGIAYAVWAGAGVVLVSLAAWWFYGQRLDLAGVAGIVLIVAGVVVLNVFSQTALH